jgi:branched-chain amino acid aminotransferase
MIATLDIKIQKTTQSRLNLVDFDNLQFGKIFSDHMFVADFTEGEWRNLSIVPYGNLSLSPALSALHYGQAIFEGLKAYLSDNQEVMSFRPLENLARMNKSAVRMCMPELPEEIFAEGLSKLMQLDKAWVPNKVGSSLYIRPLMFATDEGVGLRPSETYKFIIMTSPVGAYYPHPVKVKVETHYTRAAEGGVGLAKNAGNYGGSMYPAKLAQEQGYDQLIWTDAKEHKFVEEAGTMNLMFVFNGTLLTAPVGDTILDGVTRKSILQIARDMGVPVEERRISIPEVITAIHNGTLEEAFGAGTAATVAPICAIAYEDNEYDLAPLTEESFAFRAKKYLTDLCKGKVADKHQWLIKLA